MSADSHELLSEPEVRQLALDVARILPKDGPSLQPSELNTLLGRVISTANDPSISLSHRGASCNLLATLISQIASNNAESIRDLIWQNRIWIHSFQFVLARFLDSSPKPTKQLLGSLVSVLRKNLENPAAKSSHAWLCSELSSIFGLPAGSAPSKAHLYTLTTTLVKGAVILEQITSLSSLCDDSSSLGSTHLEILGWSKHCELGPSLASLIAALVSSASGFAPSCWFKSLIAAYEDDVTVKSAYRHYILPAIFTKDSKSLFEFLAVLNFEQGIGSEGVGTGNVEIAISTLLVASSTSMLRIDPESKEDSPHIDEQHISLPLVWLRRLSMSQSKLARIASLSVLVGETTTTEPFHESVLKLFLQKLPSMFADTDADFRSDILSIVQRIVDRVRAAGSTLMRRSDQRIGQLTRFVGQWFHALERELRPSASYQRHACALHCIKMLMKSGIDRSVAASFWSKSAKTSGNSTFQVSLFKASMRPMLFSLLLDPFDDIRSLAMSIIEALAGSDDHREALHRDLVKFLQTSAHQSVQTSRADLTDGIARAYALLYAAAQQTPIVDTFQWEITKSTIFNYLVDAFSQSSLPSRQATDDDMLKRPLHHTVIALRYIIESQAANREEDDGVIAANSRLVPSIHSTWTLVRQVLCNDAPEGYSPEDPDEEEIDLDSKSLLSFCWRAIKETSLLQRALVMSLATCKTKDSLPINYLREHLELSFTQLVELRHRGAFSTVAQTFAACCTQVVKIDPEGDTVIQSYYERGLISIRNTSTINTRRSAGLPAVIAGILSSTASSKTFDSAIDDLTAIAEEVPSFPIHDHQALPQVHALNCLREIFKNSKLGPRSDQYIPQSLLLAGQCLTSSLWGIRNSGLILFRSLIDRLLGTNDSYEDDLTRAKAKDVLTRYPELLMLALSLLDVDKDAGATQSMEKVFPALQILQRVPVPPQNKEQVCTAVGALTSSAHWHVRHKAASTYARLQEDLEVHDEVRRCLSWDVRNENARHGQLLCVRHLVKQCHDLPQSAVDVLLTSMTAVLDECYERNCSEVVVSVALDIHNHLIHQTGDYPRDPTLSIPRFARGDPQWISHMIESRVDGSQPAQSSLMTRSLASALLYEKASLSSWRSLALRMAISDPDACVFLLERAAKKCQSDRSTQKELEVFISMTTDLLDIKQGSMPINVRKGAMKLLMTVLDQEEAVSSTTPLPSATQILRLGDSPLSHDDALVLGAALIDRELSNFASSDPHRNLWELTSSLKDAAREDKPFDTRLACTVAVTKLHNVFKHFGTSSKNSGILIDLTTLVYDLTKDDDDEIRDIAASFASRVLTNEPNGAKPPAVVPLEAGPALLARLVSLCGQDPHLSEVSLSRLTTTATDPGTTPFTPVNTVLDAVQANNAALFAREKQNLFIDPVRQARIWSRVATKVPPHMPTVTKLQLWTIEGAAALVERPAALASPDGFSIALAVVYSAEVLLQFARSGTDGAVKPAAIRAALASLLDAGRQARAWPMLLEEAERVLEEDLRRGIEKVGSVLSGLGLTI